MGDKSPRKQNHNQDKKLSTKEKKAKKNARKDARASENIPTIPPPKAR